MSQIDRTTDNATQLFRPIALHDSPLDVLRDARLSADEKRAILSSWASDMYVVESQPALREIPGVPHRLRLDDILAALKQLDDGDDPPPRGALAMRLPPLNKPVRAIAEKAHGFPSHATKRYRSAHAPRTLDRLRWTSKENVRRYRKLLNTKLTDIERNFIERRLAEELRFDQCSK